MDCNKKQDQSKVGGVSNNHVERAAEGFKVKVSFDYKAVYKSKENLKKGIFYKKKTCFGVVILGGCQVVCTSGDLGLRAILVGGELPCLVQLGGPHWGQRGDVNK